MTTTPESRTTVEEELATQLATFAHRFVADLEEQGRLVETGGAGALERLRTKIEARRNLPDAYRAAVDTIVEDCGYPSDVAVRIATALQRAGLIPDDEGPEPQHDRAPVPTPPVPAPRGARVMHYTGRDAVRVIQQVTAALTPQRVEGQDPQKRPSAAQPEWERAETWTAARARAVTVAATLQTDHAERRDCMQIAPDNERVTVATKARSLDDWEYWLKAIGAPVNVPTRTAGHAQLASGSIGGVDVHLTAHDVPRLLDEAAHTTNEPMYLWGRIYDLARGQVDRHNQVWVYLGQRQDEGGMPLLALRGSPGPLYPLASIVMSNGPLTAIDVSAIAPTAIVAGGEA